MLKHPHLTMRRLERFLDDSLESKLIGATVPLSLAISRDPAIKDEAGARKAVFQPVDKGYKWGPVWSNAWFRVTGAVPEGWIGEKVQAVVQTGAETTFWRDNTPWESLDWAHKHLHVEGGPEVDLIAESFGHNPNVSCRNKPLDPPDEPFTVGDAFLFLPDVKLWSFYYDFKLALNLLKQLPQDEPRYGRLMYEMNAAVNAFYERGLEAAHDILQAEWALPANASAHNVSAIGHAHIDSAWLWPVDITIKKCAHTFANATRYMAMYPEYKFVCSQAAQYEWMRELYPGLFKRMQEFAKKGQWEPAGSMWVEADCNVPSGESLVRQFLYGKRYFKEHFGVETTDMWLPDVFGYSASLPQIMKLAGIEYFSTQKITWCTWNPFPHHTFLWQGIDGTQIFSHMYPAHDYNSNMTPETFLRGVKNFRDKDRASRWLYVYGYGDGGGGPTIEMLENSSRIRDIEGLPKVQLEKVSDFFPKAKADAKDLPVWAGELYFELHRGTYTTQANNKKHNRKLELLLRDAEMLSAMLLPPEEYPRKELAEAWKIVLFNQFHDILPGSSVREVYEQTDKEYAKAYEIVEPLIAKALKSGDGEGVVCVNTREASVAPAVVSVPVPAGEVPKCVIWSDTPDEVQISDGQLLFHCAEQQIGCTEVARFGSEEVAPGRSVGTLSITDRSLENALIRATLDDNGNLASVVLKAKDWDRDEGGKPELLVERETEVIKEGCAGNELQLMVDIPQDWEAWDVDVYALETAQPILSVDSIEVVERGPVRAAIRVTRTFGSSKIVQDIRLVAGSPCLEFHTEIDWHEEQKMLKAAFPVQVNSPRATYEIQFGHLERPTHRNTTWDIAKFEVCGQKWADLSDGGWGVALINDSKYGYDCLGDTLRLSLLRAPNAPDPKADRGHHSFTYWLYPHEGSLQDAEVVALANALNSPPRVVRTDRDMKAEWVYVLDDWSGVCPVVDTIKRAEDSDDIIVRLYEAHNARGRAAVEFGFPVTKAWRCDLLEREQEELPVTDNSVMLDVKPFEIITLKLRSPFDKLRVTTG